MGDFLLSSGPATEYADKLMQYGQFVGSWDIDCTWFDSTGAQTQKKGEWHFGWILGGRGVQDVLFVKGAPPENYGTTLRCYDPSLDAWHIVWMQPYGREFVHLIGRKVGDRMINEGCGYNLTQLERWSFTEITASSFVWRGEISTDNGQTWILQQEMRAVRVSS